MISWFITNLRFMWLIIPIVIIWLISFAVTDTPTRSDDDYPLPFIIITLASVVAVFVSILGAVNAHYVSDSTEPWNKVYTNELHASVELSTTEQSLTAGKQLTYQNVNALNDMYYHDELVTIEIGDGNNSSSRKVRITSVEGDVNENMTITKIEYRKATTFHYQVFGLDGNPQTSDYDGDIRIVLSRPDNEINSLFGD